MQLQSDSCPMEPMAMVGKINLLRYSEESRGINGPLQESTSLLFEYFVISCPIISKIKTAKDTIKKNIISEGSALKYKREKKEEEDTTESAL